MRGGHFQLLYLCGELPELLTVHMAGMGGSEETCQYIASILRAASATDCWQTHVLGELIDIFDAAFTKHLEQEMNFFAQAASDVWTTAMDAYIKEVITEVTEWATAQQEVEGASKHITFINDIPARVTNLLSRHVMTGFPFVPAVPGGVPLLCPKSLVALYNVFLDIAPAISLVGPSVYLSPPPH